jgi:hypothetical protein
MNSTKKNEVTLEVAADAAFLPLVAGFVEKSALAFGLDEAEATALEMASQQLFAYLGHAGAPGQDVWIRCLNRGYYVRVEFDFQAEDITVPAMNMTTSVDIPQALLGLEIEPGREDTHLLIASRMVDRFAFGRSKEGFHFSLTKERTYPGISDSSPPRVTPIKEYSIQQPVAEDLKLLVRMVVHQYESHIIPPPFHFPGKVADMEASGDCRAALALDDQGRIGGGIIWKWDSAKLVECFGPYVVSEPPDSSMARDLLEFCIAAVARSHVLGIICRFPTPELPREYFEPLGTLTFLQDEGGPLEVTALYRHLEEDLGTSVWVHPLTESFLISEYKRLCLPREIRKTSDEGEHTPPFSVLSAEFDRDRGKITLRPIWWGLDAQAVVSEHVKFLKKDRFQCMAFEIDLGKTWQTRFTPALLAEGFEPRYVLPYGGTSDLIVLEYKER